MSVNFSLILKEFIHFFHNFIIMANYLNILLIFIPYSFAGPFNLLSTLY